MSAIFSGFIQTDLTESDVRSDVELFMKLITLVWFASRTLRLLTDVISNVKVTRAIALFFSYPLFVFVQLRTCVIRIE